MEIEPISHTDTVPTARRIARVDGRSKAAKRVKELAASYIARLGGRNVDAATLAAIQKAAELAALAEELRGRALRGEAVDLGEMVKVEGVADRAARALGLDRLKRDNDDRSLDEYLDTKYDADPTADVPDQPNDVFGAEVAIADDTHANAPAVDEGNGSDSEAAA